MLPGGGAAEIEVARQLAEHARRQTGLDQYAIAKFAEALEVVPRWGQPLAGRLRLACRGFLGGGVWGGLDQYAIAKFAEALEVVPRWVAVVWAGWDSAVCLGVLPGGWGRCAIAKFAEAFEVVARWGSVFWGAGASVK